LRLSLLILVCALVQSIQAAVVCSTNSPLHTSSYFHTTVLLSNGKVLVAGGDNITSGPSQAPRFRTQPLDDPRRAQYMRPQKAISYRFSFSSNRC
jgi:hypothetical protein